MEYVECRAHDTICIGERIRLTVMERRRDSVMLAVVAALDSDVRFAYDALRGEPLDGSQARYLLPLLTGDSFTVDDIRVGIGLYLDRREIAANDDCDIQLQISRLEIGRLDIGRLKIDPLRIDGQQTGQACAAGSRIDAIQGLRTAENGSAMRIRCLRADAGPEGERSGSCSP